LDLVYIAGGAGFIVASVLYTRFCERVLARTEEQR